MISVLRVSALVLGVVVGTAVPASAAPLSGRALIMAAFAAMGGGVPADITLHGAVTVATGASIGGGTIVAMTKGTGLSREEWDESGDRRAIRFHDGDACECKESTCMPLPLERSVTAPSSIVPLFILGRALNNPQAAFEALGAEMVGGAPAQHVRFWDFTDRALAAVWDASVWDVWLDAENRPVQMAWSERMATGRGEGVHVVATYSDYRRIGGYVLPFAIRRTRNGVPWMAITVSDAQANVGLSDSLFTLCGGEQ